MAISEININNLTSGILSLDINLGEKRAIRDSLAVGASVNVASKATLDELNRNPEILRLRGIDPSGTPKISITTTASDVSDDIADVKKDLLWRGTISADSTLAADVIGATTEAAHTAVTIPAAMLGTARRVVKFSARLHVVSSNATDTWIFRSRLGGLAGTLLQASSAIDLVDDDVYVLSGEISVRTLGASGTFDSVCQFQDVVADSRADAEVVAGALNTTVARDLTITGFCSTNNAGNQVALRHLEVEVWSV